MNHIKNPVVIPKVFPSKPLDTGTDHTFTFFDHADDVTTKQELKLVINAWMGNLSVTITDPRSETVYGEVYLELYAGNLAVNLYDQDTYGGDGERFILASFDTQETQP